MALDLNRIVQAAAEAVLEDRGDQRRQQSSSKRKGITAPRAMLLGAGLFTAGRLLVGSRGRNLVENFQDRLAELEDRYLADDAEDAEGEEDFDDDEEFEDEEPEAQADEDEEPEDEEPEDEFEEDEADEEPEDEFDEEEPEGEFDDEEEPEGEADEEPDEEPEDEPRRTSSAAGRRNGRH